MNLDMATVMEARKYPLYLGNGIIRPIVRGLSLCGRHREFMLEYVYIHVAFQGLHSHFKQESLQKSTYLFILRLSRICTAIL